MQERGYQKIQILFKVKSLNKINIFKNSSSSNKDQTTNILYDTIFVYFDPNSF